MHVHHAAEAKQPEPLLWPGQVRRSTMEDDDLIRRNRWLDAWTAPARSDTQWLIRVARAEWCTWSRALLAAIERHEDFRDRSSATDGELEGEPGSLVSAATGDWRPNRSVADTTRRDRRDLRQGEAD